VAPQAEAVGSVERDQQIVGAAGEAVAGLALDAAVEEFEPRIDARPDREPAAAAGTQRDAVGMAGVLGEARGDRGELLRGGLAPGLAVAEQAALRRRQAGEPGRVGVVDGGRRAVPVAQGCEIAPGRVAGAAEGPGGRFAVREAEDRGAGADLRGIVESVAVEATAAGTVVEGQPGRRAERLRGMAVAAGDIAAHGDRPAAGVATVAGRLLVGGQRGGHALRGQGQRERPDRRPAEP